MGITGRSVREGYCIECKEPLDPVTAVLHNYCSTACYDRRRSRYRPRVTAADRIRARRNRK